MRCLSILLSLCLFQKAPAQDNSDIDQIANVVERQNGTGPDRKFIKDVYERMQSVQLRTSTFNRQGTGGGTDMNKQYQTLRKSCGPKSNQTTGEGETHDALRNFALQGDMILSPPQIDNLISNQGRKKRGATTDASYYWNPNIPVPYEIDSSLNRIRSQILAGIKFWSDHSCISFVENPFARNRLRYYYGQGCWSYVGKQSAWASQDISIGDGCTSLGTICHETMHALGFYHTQSNPDRDSFINVNFNNIQSTLQYNFDKMTAQTNNILGVSYDYGSVMQYPPYAFAVNPNIPTSMSKDANYQNLMGQREGPAFSDIKQLNTLYKCADRCGRAVACQNNGIVNSKTCNSCICPRYFTGPTCNMLPQGTAPACNGQTIQADSTSWQSTTLSFGNGLTYQYAPLAVDCYWLIQAPIGYKIQIQMQSIDTTCMESCPWAGFEINLGNLDQSGMLVCCQSFSGYSYTSQSNLVPIRGISRYNDGNMIANVIQRLNGRGPDRQFILDVLERMQSVQLRTSPLGRKGTGSGGSDLSKRYQTLRKSCGPRSNQTSNGGETHDALKDFALQGDMILNPKQIDNIISNDGRKKRGATTDSSYYWDPNVPIAYEIDSSLSSIRSRILAAIQYWAEHSCINFVENPNADNRLRYYYGQGCWSYVGKQSEWVSQDISIGDGCTSLGTICHETMHALGFYHTQSNPDRDTYIDVYLSNIQSTQQYNFDKMNAATNNILGISYDYGSVMQYPPYAFAVNPNIPTSMSKDPNYQNLMGQRDGPAFSDIKQLNTLYKCAARCSKSVACQNNGIVNSKTCNSCICPKYFAGTTCNMLPVGTAPVCNGQVIQADSTSWQSITLNFGNGLTNQYTPSVDCYWLIQAPVGYKIQIQMQSIDTTCMESCPWAGFEINLGNLDQSGMLVCCQSYSSYTYTSVKNMIPIRGTSRFNNGNMVLKYRVVS